MSEGVGGSHQIAKGLLAIFCELFQKSQRVEGAEIQRGNLVRSSARGEIPKEDQSMIYERFYRGDNVNTAGAGVGLAIVKDIADLHQATIEIDSRKDKKGTRFYVFFELTPEI